MKSGIYRWFCIPTGKRYIGQAFDLKKRKRQFLNFSSRYSSKSDNIKGVDAARDIMRDSTNKEFRRCYAAVKNCLNPNNPAKTARGYYYKLI